RWAQSPLTRETLLLVSIRARSLEGSHGPDSPVRQEERSPLPLEILHQRRRLRPVRLGRSGVRARPVDVPGPARRGQDGRHRAARGGVWGRAGWWPGAPPGGGRVPPAAPPGRRGGKGGRAGGVPPF